MAGRKKDIQIQTPIHNEMEWNEMFEAKGLSVVDIHQGWCGPCKSISSVFRKLKMEFGDELLHFNTVEASLIPLLKGFEGKCEPAFIFIVAGKIADYVKGVNAPVINKKIVAFLENEIAFYEKGVERQEVETVQLYDVEDEMEDFMQAAISKQVDKLFTVLVIKPNTLITGNDNVIKEQVSEAGFQIMAEEMVHLTEEEAKELYEHKKHQRNFEEIVQTMSSGVCDILLLSEEGETKDFEHEFDVQEAEMVKTNDEDSDIRELAYRLFSFFFPTVYEKFKKTEKTLAIIRPQLLQEQKDEILEEITNARFTIGRQKEIKLTEQQMTKFYSLNEEISLPPGFIEYMISGPILVLVLMRDNAIKHWRSLLGPHDLETAKEEYPLSLRARFAIEDVPFNQLHGSHDDENARKELHFFFPVEHTLVAVKAVALRECKDAIIIKIQQASFTISAIKSVEMSQETAAEFYKDYEEEPFFKQLTVNMSKTPIVMMILTKENAVREWKELIGPVDHELAKASFPNSIRAQLDISISQNGFHSPSTVKLAKHHIMLFFGDAFLDSFGVNLEEELPISEIPSVVPSTTAIEPSDLVDVEAPTDEQQIPTAEAPDEAADATTEEVPDTGEAPDATTEEVPDTGEAPDAPTEEVPDTGEAPDATTEEVPDTGEAPDATTEEVPDTGEAPDAPTEEVPDTGEAPDAPTEEVPDTGEAPDAPTEEVPDTGEAPDATAEEVPDTGEAPDAPTEEVPDTGEAPDAPTEEVPDTGEAPDAPTEEVPDTGEAPDATTEEVPDTGEAPDATAEEVPDTGEAPDANAEEVPDTGEAPDATTEEVPDTGEAPDASAEEVPDTGEAPDATTEEVPEVGEAPDATTATTE
ncbi:thioredoxin domain-containing protein 3-like [Scyliorhinus canicula]|uniref:thioredoxin domain-containing protein 3-like n=1 Tax=Scyliorhinus canicula TaxID=7830 RepID=UPI0018F67FB8|nr:thioredoxin domain-containing protein 3-like [Scyliorhinus canicula]